MDPPALSSTTLWHNSRSFAYTVRLFYIPFCKFILPQFINSPRIIWSAVVGLLYLAGTPRSWHQKRGQGLLSPIPESCLYKTCSVFKLRAVDATDSQTRALMKLLRSYEILGRMRNGR